MTASSLLRYLSMSSALVLFCVACSDDTKTQSQGLDSSLVKKLSTTATIQHNPMGKYEQMSPEEQLAFNVSADKIEKFINDTEWGVSFAPPRNFTLATYNSLPNGDITTKFTKYSGQGIVIEPIYAFRNRTTMVVSRIDFTTTKDSYRDFLKKYEILVREKFTPASITPTSFKKGNLEMTQFFIQEAERGLFRIIVPTLEKGRAFQFDYSIERQTAADDVQIIEPSIGTITLLAKAAR